MSRLLTNISTATVQLPDLQGTFLVPNDTVDLENFNDKIVRNSLSIVAELIKGTIVYSDGSKNFATNDAISLIRDQQQILATTDGGKQLVIATTRPTNTLAYFTGRGDDVANKKISGGDPLIYHVAPGQTVTKKVQFTEQIYFIQGVLSYTNAEIGSTLNQEVWCPAGLPFPATGMNGNYDIDLTTGTVTPNPTNTGGYFIKSTDTLVAKFINDYLLFGTDHATIRADDVARLYKGWYMALSVYNSSSSQTIDGVINMQIYRTVTVNGS